MAGMNSMESHYQSMNQVYDYIDHNLSGDLSVGALARISGYSAYHFHRLFHAMTGKSVHAFVFEQRLVAAASRVLYEHVSLTQIALDCGFSSSGQFSRCFKQYFGCSPSHYRAYKERKRPSDSNHPVCMQYRPDAETDGQFTISHLSDLHVAGIGAKSLSKDFTSRDIESAFQQLFAWLRKKNMLDEALSVVGITLDTPEVLPLDQCRYFACVEASDRFRSEGKVSVRTFPTAGKFVCFSLVRDKKDFADTFFHTIDYLYGCYFPRTGLIPDNRPFVEYYTQRDTGIEITFYIPVK